MHKSIFIYFVAQHGYFLGNSKTKLFVIFPNCASKESFFELAILVDLKDPAKHKNQKIVNDFCE